MCGNFGIKNNSQLICNPGSGVELVEIGRISSKHVRVTVASPKGAQIPRSVGATPPMAGTLSATAMNNTLNNHLSTNTEETPKLLAGKEELTTDLIEEMDTREGVPVVLFLGVA